jgi:hypothetical protein
MLPTIAITSLITATLIIALNRTRWKKMV